MDGPSYLARCGPGLWRWCGRVLEMVDLNSFHDMDLRDAEAARWRMNEQFDNDVNIETRIDENFVPEPSSIALALLSMFTLTSSRRRTESR